ncbi:MAG: hypothetical protein ACR2N9_05615 [Acidimicrobiia bacterium]
MHDMNAFEQQIAREVVAEAGPEPRFDAMSVSRSVTTHSPTRRFQSMFSATKLVVAGAVVALFGGFLLSGVLTTQQSDPQPPAAAASATASASPAPVPVTTVTGRYGVDFDVDPGPTTTALPGGGERSISLFPHLPIEVSDPRIDGNVLLQEIVDDHPDVRYRMMNLRLETADGAWQAEPVTSIDDGSTPGAISDTFWVGEGAYEGLLLVAALDFGGAGFELSGHIVQSDLPAPATGEASAE